MIKHKETGIMVAPGDIDGIGESLISLIEAPDARAQYGEALYKLVTSKFGIERMSSAYANLYKTLVFNGADKEHA